LRKLLLLLFVLLLPASGLFSQSKKIIDSLNRLLRIARPDTEQVKIQSRLAFAYFEVNPAMVIKIGHDALALARSVAWQPGVALACNRYQLRIQK
jgi:hypothetical protein